MTTCPKCKNLIPEGMKLCPHCGLLPPRLFPKFFLYILMTAVAVISAVIFRPFAGAPQAESVSMGVLWSAFVIFCVFALIFIFVSVVLWRDYSRRSYRGRLTKSEVARFVRMKKHIEQGNHSYGKNGFCTVCGAKRSR